MFTLNSSMGSNGFTMSDAGGNIVFPGSASPPISQHAGSSMYMNALSSSYNILNNASMLSSQVQNNALLGVYSAGVNANNTVSNTSSKLSSLLSNFGKYLGNKQSVQTSQINNQLFGQQVLSYAHLNNIGG